MSAPWVFTPETMEAIGKMRAEGKTSRQIAEAVGSTPDSVRQTLHYRHMKRPHDHRLEFQIGATTKEVYAREAERRGIKCRVLIRRVLTMVARDNLFSAIIDDDV